MYSVAISMLPTTTGWPAVGTPVTQTLSSARCGAIPQLRRA